MSKMRVLLFGGALLLLGAIGGVYVWHARSNSANTTQEVTANVGSYAALGDSVAAGDGLAKYVDASACDRTTTSYPELIAKQAHYDLQFIACSGASSQVGILEGQEVNKLTLEPQIKQLTTLATKPTLITMTIGANDMSWLQIFGACYTATCGTPAETALVSTRLAGLKTNLTNAFDTLQNDYTKSNGTPPKVMITGYYQPFAATVQSCSEMKDFDANELAWARSKVDDLNTTIKDVANNYSFATYVPVDFTGHELCTEDAWVQDFQAKAAFHPTDDGQQAIAKAIIAREATLQK